MRKLIILFICFFATSILHASNPDSVGTKVKNGVRYVVHKTAEGQGLYRIGKIYDVSVRKIEKANPELETSNLQVNQLILVPREQVKPQRASAPGVRPGGRGNKKQPQKQAVYHRVAQGESLYRISQQYEVLVKDLKAWNELDNDELDIGQKLVVGYEKQPENKAKKSKTGNEPDQKGNAQEKDSPEKKEKTKKKEKEEDPQSATPGQNVPQRASINGARARFGEDSAVKSNTSQQTISEEGVGGWIDDGALGSNKALALHDDAPVGAIIQVHNKLNDKTVFVKVVGRIPKSRRNRDYTILISKPAADILEVYDKKFRVDIEYSTRDAYTGG